MVITLFTGKVIFVNQSIITLEVYCLRLAGGDVEWLGKNLGFQQAEQTMQVSSYFLEMFNLKKCMFYSTRKFNIISKLTHTFVELNFTFT